MKTGIRILICITLLGCDLVERKETKNSLTNNHETIDQASVNDSTLQTSIDSTTLGTLINPIKDSVNLSLLEIEDEFDYVYTSKLKSGVKIKWIERNTGKKIRSDEMLMLEYRLSLPDGRIIDGNNKMKMPYVPFVVGYNMQQKGWDIALQEMCIGDVAKIEIPSDLAYGSKGLGSVIPPNTDNWLFLKIHGVVKPDYDQKGVRYWELQSGEESTSRRNKVKFHMIASTKNKANIFNTYASNFPLTYASGQKNYPKGLEQVLKKANEGQYLFLILDSEMAYGTKGYTNLIQANESVFYNLKIIDVE
jgi:FKBP-type peptidyl-prolyl cis-trans isomerase